MSSLEDVYWLEDSQANKALGKDAEQWSKVRQKLPTSKTQLDTMKADLWSTIVKSSQHQDAWAWGDVLVVSMSFAGLITLAAVTQPSLAPEARNSLLQYVTGKYLMPSNCKVTFDWIDPHVVGDTMIFTVRFFQRNGKPYPICDTDQFYVEVVSEGSRKVVPFYVVQIQVIIILRYLLQVVVLSELGSESNPNNANVAKVKFTIRTAGQYKISVMIGSSHVSGSPFVRNFLPGPIDANKSRLVRPANTVVCCASAVTLLYVEPRDQFGNGCVFKRDVDAVQVV